MTSTSTTPRNGGALPSTATMAAALIKQVQSFRFALQPVVMGTVTEIGDGIARISGLDDVMLGEMLLFEGDTPGMALNLEETSVGAIILGEYEHIRAGSIVRAVGHVISVPVGNALLGRVVDALGRPLDEGEPLATTRTRAIEHAAPGIVDRAAVNVPLQTGIKSIDALVPIGRGQRELIVGDRQTGKTTLAIDAIINQRKDDVLCIYVAIGQKLSSVAQTVGTLQRHGAMERTIVVVAEASAPAALQYIAPYAGCAMAEGFMEDGRDVLIVYDDLTKHAWAYRQISLLLRRPPGREAFPGDVFYLHARLLERAGHLRRALGGGSMTALPIIETQLGDLTAYIPTNVISITDGQIFLEEGMFNAGVRPAINAGLSVSRVAGAAQSRTMKAVAGQLRLEMAQFRELEAFAQFGTEVDPTTQRALERGLRLRELLKQGTHRPVAVEDQIALYFAATRGYLDDIPVNQVDEFETQFIAYLHEHRQSLRSAIVLEGTLSEELARAIGETVDEFKRDEMAIGATVNRAMAD